LIRQATESDDLGERESRLRAAIALSRGHPLAELAGLAWFDEQARRLEHMLRQARLALVDTQLMLGRHRHLVPELETLSHQHALDERIHGQLMLALYRAGRQSDALAAYQRLRRLLLDELGIDPSRPLRDLETAILHQDPALDAPPPAPRSRSLAAPRAVPAQLPPAIDGFGGRARELAELDRLLADADIGAAQPTTVLISAISGTAGVGKTALAVQWARRVAAYFPDGQLYVNLRGFDPAASPVDPNDAVRVFLDALGVPVERIPTDLDARVGLYRSLLAGKRLMVVLDNARDAGQVRSLLPGALGCMALVTSRNQLTSLAVTEGVHPLTLDLLSYAEAHDLLARRLGGERLADEPDAADEIIASCARLPLALAITAARAAIQPSFSLSAIAAELRETAAPLDALHDSDPATDLRAVFSWSYRTLGIGAARMFRLLGLHPGPDIGVPAAASLAGVAVEESRRLLAELARAHLLTECGHRRYTFHDLLRAYAAERAHTDDSAVDARLAVQRMLDHYLHTAHAATLQLNQQAEPIDLPQPQPGVISESIEGHDNALAWFTTEHQVLLAAVERAAAEGFDTHAWQLSKALHTFLLRRGHWPDHMRAHRTALDAARRLGDRAGEAQILRELARVHARAGRFDEAGSYYHESLRVYSDLDDAVGQAHAYLGLAGIAEHDKRPADVLEHSQRALALYRTSSHLAWHAYGLNAVGWSHALLGDYRQAVSYCEEALTVLQGLGDRYGQALTLDSLGAAYRGLADYQRAIDSYQNAVGLHRELGDRTFEADRLTSLADTYEAAGDTDAAREAWQSALEILDQLNDPGAEAVRDRLSLAGGRP
jgi:tetratricopeptide (TPR) repeat protein